MINNLVEQKKEELIKKVKKNKYSDEDIQNLIKAIEFADLKHKDQLRKSGEPYFIHPLSTAIFLVEWNMDIQTVIGGIFHDLLEDTKTTEEEIETNFSLDILKLVKIVTKVSEVSKSNRSNIVEEKIESEYLVDLLLSMAHDLRGMIIKLADRLHNMLTIQYLKPEKQKKIANETLNIYANIAGRLGMYFVKTQLLDTSFKVLDNQAYLSTKAKIDKIVEKNINEWNLMMEKIDLLISSYGINFKMDKRQKGIYSTHQKLLKNININDIRDIYAIRIITNEPIECYSILGIIHMNFKYIPKTWFDYISNPKFNLYQSIHTTITSNKIMLEVQIRTNKMDDYANYGLAAHWKYKQISSEVKKEINNTVQYILMNEILQKNLNKENIQDFELTSNDNIVEIMVNNNKMILANKKSTVLDIAFQYDKNNFFKISKIAKNGKLVKFSSTVEKGDSLIFYYSMYENFSKKWLSWTMLLSTKDFIKEEISNRDSKKILDVDSYLNLLKDKLKNNWVGKKETERILHEYFQFYNISEFLSYIKTTKQDINKITNIFSKVKSVKKEAYKKLAFFSSEWLLYKNYLTTDQPILIKSIKFADCCNKVPGMKLIANLNKNILYVHNESCSDRKYKFSNSSNLLIKWNDEKINNDKKTFPYDLSFSTYWTQVIGNEIAEHLSDYDLDLSKIEVIRNGNKNCIINLLIYTNHIDKITNWLSAISQITTILEK